MKSRIKAILACALAMLFFGSLFALYGYDDTWRLWNIPTMSPHFADLRTITGGAESHAQGFDPMIMNPGDPWQRKLNYPRVWQSLYSIGINQSHTTYLGIAFILLFFAGVCLVLPHASYVMVLLVIAAVLSPATLLGIERGNIDLLMFFLAALSAVAAKRWHALSATAVLLGFILKLFPIFGCSILLRINRSTFSKYALLIITIATLYIALTYSDLILIAKGTPQSISLSYGLNVFWMNLASLDATIGWYAKILSYLAVLLALGYAFTALLRDDFPEDSLNPAVYLDAFRAGAAIYVGTFLLGNNWDYRLMFLILTIPQLLIWIRCSARYIALVSGAVLLSVFLSLWYLLIIIIAFDLPYGDIASFALDEISHWLVFTGLLYLFFWSMPDWLKEYAQKMRTRVGVR